MPGIGLIGYGYWGPNLARAIAEVDAAALCAIADFSPAALERAGRRHPSARLVTDWRDLVADPSIDAVVISTPVSTHFDMALAALRAGKHVLVEKPITDNVFKAALLVEEAARRSLTLMVDHTFIYTGAVRKIKDLITDGSIGDVYCYDATRVNLGLLQKDVSVIWDLAVHDFAILDFLIDARPVAISASAAAFLPDSPETMAHLSIYFDDGAMAHLNVNWMSPVKIRQTLISGRQRMIIYDDMQNSEKIKVYDRGVDLAENLENVHERRVSYRMGEMWAPAISTKEALVTEIEQFVHSIEGKGRPPSDGESGLRVVEMLAAATRSAALRGQPMELVDLRRAS
ncbi:Gfo/Idh/MocA family oxidoreductase [Mesorhizobium sp. BR1-1-16]|uniref:Gfo/Idh/MocA family protein n=1 Tax=Mesorhizobium sp. BR1-1-16 TaxID=2876653 RepID=UPI001CCEC742|nr:Gfo/Idh/MocA family oxidoreductase [Mesorhizobium sp. BR1-1-16]MBZ9936037.1 Gfo/Idh/MocA family oxidoreductase [Mesorhizobium sp. BR1-1-16]